MIRVLLRKQMAEMFRSYFYNPKKNTGRSKAGTIAFFGFFILIMVGVLGGMFAYLAHALCGTLHAAGVAWLYFLIMGMLAILYGAFGSVFNTYAGLYLGKDNDLLLSMPIPVRAILVSRLLGVYLLGLMYSAVVCVPTLIIYWITAGFAFAHVAGGLLWFLLISVFVLVLSCALGWVVARISVKLKNRSFVTVFLSIAFIALYYFVYFKAQSMIRDLLQNAVLYGEKIRGSARLLYVFGKAGTGDGLSLLLMAAVILGLFALTCWALSRSFLKIATATRETAKVRYKEKPVRQASPDAALLRKELRRFTASANYMLNCGLGLLFQIALGVFLLIKGRDTLALLQTVFGGETTAVLACAVLLMLLSLNDMTAPSVSLEGRTIWQVQALPVTAWQALRAKLRMQLLLTLPAALFCSVCIALTLSGSLPLRLLIPVLAVTDACFIALLGLATGVRMPNLAWTNENVPVKQSAPVAITMLGSMALSAVFAGLYFWLRPDALLYVGLAVGILALASAALYLWLRKRGAKRFETL